MWNEPRASLGLNVVTVMLLRAADLPRRRGTYTMQQQWPDPNEPNPSPIQDDPAGEPTQPPGAPHTPESPRETPQPRDPRGPGGSPAPDREQA